MSTRSRHLANITQLRQVAERLGSMNDTVVYIGGSVVGLLISDKGAPDARPTDDVDLIVETTGIDYGQAEATLAKLGFEHDLSEDAHMHRYLLDGLKVDILPVDGKAFGMNTEWHPAVLRTAQIYKFEDDLSIRIISPPLLICTKLAAHADRGNNELKMSKDFGDILALTDGREELYEEISNSEIFIKAFIAGHFKTFLNDHIALTEVFSWQLDRDQLAREDLILNRMKKIAKCHN